jgi:hypothetical protein
MIGDLESWIRQLMFNPRHVAIGTPDDTARVMAKVEDLVGTFCKRRRCEPMKDELVRQWRERNPAEGQSVPVVKSLLPA